MHNAKFSSEPNSCAVSTFVTTRGEMRDTDVQPGQDLKKPNKSHASTLKIYVRFHSNVLHDTGHSYILCF